MTRKESSRSILMAQKSFPIYLDQKFQRRFFMPRMKSLEYMAFSLDNSKSMQLKTREAVKYVHRVKYLIFWSEMKSPALKNPRDRMSTESLLPGRSIKERSYLEPCPSALDAISKSDSITE